jgi:hypothetical protein
MAALTAGTTTPSTICLRISLIPLSRWRHGRLQSPASGPYLAFVRVCEDRMVENRVHLGCTAGRSTTLVADLQALSLRTIEDAEDWESH